MAKLIEHGLSFTEQKTDSSHKVGKLAVVIGAGIGGLATAGALAQYFEQVEILERDRLATSVASRSGTPQDRHPHGLLAGGLRALDQIFPGFQRDLAEAGAVPVTFARDVQFERPDVGVLPKRDFGISVLCATRPLIEQGVAATGRGAREHHAAAGVAGDRDCSCGRRCGRQRRPVCQRFGTAADPRH